MGIATSRTIDYTPDQVWQVIGEQFADISHWSKAIKSSSMSGDLGVGAVRTCELDNGSKLKEKVTQYDPGHHSMTYLVESGVPPMLYDLQNAITVTPAGSGKSEVTSVLTPNVKWWAKPMMPLMKKQFGKMMGGMLDDLATEVGRQVADAQRA